MTEKKKLYVVTNPELGWDCVVGVYTDKEYVDYKYGNKEEYIIHEEYEDNSTAPDFNIEITKEWEVDDNSNFEIIDTLEVSISMSEWENSPGTINHVVNKFKEFCAENDIEIHNTWICSHMDTGRDFWAGAKITYPQEFLAFDYPETRLGEAFDEFLKLKGVRTR